jgi:hypothetical protein
VNFRKDTWESENGYVVVYEYREWLGPVLGHGPTLKRWIGELKFFVPLEEFDINKYFPHLTGKAIVVRSGVTRREHGFAEFEGVGKLFVEWGFVEDEEESEDEEDPFPELNVKE